MRVTLSIILYALLASRSTATPPSAAAHVGKGYELVQSERFAEAIPEFRAALALDPGALPVRYQLAVCLFAVGERDESRKVFEQLRRESKNDAGVAYYLGRLDLLSGKSADAIQRLAPLVAHPPFPDTAFYLGCAYLAGGDLSHALTWLQQAVQADRDDFRVHYRFARALRQAGRIPESEQEYALSTELRERYNEGARQSVACVQALHGQPLADAREVCNRLFSPNDPDKLTTLGMLYGENAQFAEAIDPLRRAAELDPESFEIFHNLGLTYFRLRRFAEARAPLERAVALRPNYFGSNALLGAALYSLKEDDAAYRVLDLAHQLKPEDADVAKLLFRTSLILAKRSAVASDYRASLAFLGKAGELQPEDGEVQRLTREVRGRLSK